MIDNDISDIELNLVIDAVNKKYGYDFHNYSKASLKRRINNFLLNTKYKTISELIPPILYDSLFFESFIYDITVNVTEMFRDPFVYRAIKNKIIPYLKTFPFIKIWHAGCSTGEEVYSLAILLTEENMYERVTIYATDINDNALNKAKEGIYSIDQIKSYSSNYQEFGGKFSFSDYYHSKYNSVIINNNLKKNITFSNHNLVSDSSFGQMHLLMCRNVLIYFNSDLQNKVLKLFNESIITNGFLCLGSKESIGFSDIQKSFKEISKRERIYQKKI